MLSDREIWATATALINGWGDGADLEAARHHDACLDRGDVAGCAVWKRVIKALEELRREAPKQNEGVH